MRKTWKIRSFLPLFCFLLQIAPRPAVAENLHLIDQLPNGFRIYRSGLPSRKDLAEFDKLGIEEIAVLSGDAEGCEIKYSDIVPRLKVVYDHHQEDDKPLTASFLRWFDEWVQEARLQGKVIVFRCICGCHRTGRLAAYYQMKYQGLTAEDAILIMNRYGSRMNRRPWLEHQVRALDDYVHGRPCSQAAAYCVVSDLKPDDRQPVPDVKRQGSH